MEAGGGRSGVPMQSPARENARRVDEPDSCVDVRQLLLHCGLISSCVRNTVSGMRRRRQGIYGTDVRRQTEDVRQRTSDIRRQTSHQVTKSPSHQVTKSPSHQVRRSALDLETGPQGPGDSETRISLRSTLGTIDTASAIRRPQLVPRFLPDTDARFARHRADARTAARPLRPRRHEQTGSDPL